MIAAFDLDGTLLNKNSSLAFCRYLRTKGFFTYSDLFFCLRAYIRHFYLGLSLLHLHTIVFKKLFLGKDLGTLTRFAESFLDDKLSDLLYSPAVHRLQVLQGQGVECCCFSNSPRFLVKLIAERIGIFRVFATEYQIDHEEKLEKLVLLMDGPEKARKLATLSLPTIAFSDSALDLPFLRAAHTAIAVNPDRKLRKIARREKWEIL